LLLALDFIARVPGTRQRKVRSDGFLGIKIPNLRSPPHIYFRVPALC
jgi:hypothetical protein